MANWLKKVKDYFSHSPLGFIVPKPPLSYEQREAMILRPGERFATTSKSDIIIITGMCLAGDCDCIKYNGAEVEDVGIPPFHDGCTCSVVGTFLEKQKSDLESLEAWLHN